MTRGMKGCYVYFTDKETAKFFQSHLIDTHENQTEASHVSPATISNKPSTNAVLPFKRLEQRAVKPYVNAVPLVDLKFAAGVFSDTQLIEDAETIWVTLPDIFRPQRGLFVAQVVGESMNRRIPNGAWCLFRIFPTGTRQGKIVVAQHRSIYDPDLGGSYTIKIYQSEKATTTDGEWAHTRITLKPDSTDAGYADLQFDPDTADGLTIVAELIATL